MDSKSTASEAEKIESKYFEKKEEELLKKRSSSNDLPSNDEEEFDLERLERNRRHIQKSGQRLK